MTQDQNPIVSNIMQQHQPQQQGAGGVIYKPRPLDVLLGRGRMHAVHHGNKQYNVTIDGNVDRYNRAKTREQKTVIMQQVVDQIRMTSGRFLRYDSQTKGWIEVSNDVAREKVGQSFRNRRKETKKVISELRTISVTPPPPEDAQFKVYDDQQPQQQQLKQQQQQQPVKRPHYEVYGHHVRSCSFSSSEAASCVSDLPSPPKKAKWSPPPADVVVDGTIKPTSSSNVHQQWSSSYPDHLYYHHHQHHYHHQDNNCDIDNSSILSVLACFKADYAGSEHHHHHHEVDVMNDELSDAAQRITPVVARNDYLDEADYWLMGLHPTTSYSSLSSSASAAAVQAQSW